MQHRLLTAWICLLLGALSSCAPEADDGTPPIGYWRAQLALPGGAAPFGLELGREGEGFRATLINGPERVNIPVVVYDDVERSFLLKFPAFNNEITARYADGTLTGTLTLVKRDGTQAIPFSATPGNVGGGVAAADLDASGRWAVTFTEDDGRTYPAVGEFAQRGARLVGTFLTEKGDYRYLEGEVRGSELSLSTFDGAHAFLFKAKRLPNKSLIGDFWSGLSSHETFIAERDEEAKLPDANTLTYLKPGVERFTFSFPGPDGKLVSLDDAQFDGKVVIVTLAGSWCPNCHDEAAFMAEFYKRYQEQGLEVIALMFEHSEDFAEAAEQVRRFRAKFDLTYPTLIAGSSDKDLAAEKLPELNHVLAFPTTLFIDRRGTVRRIHTGFRGPGTGDHYKTLTDKFESFVNVLLAEPAVEPVPEIAPELLPGDTDLPLDTESDETLPADTAPGTGDSVKDPLSDTEPDEEAAPDTTTD